MILSPIFEKKKTGERGELVPDLISLERVKKQRDLKLAI